jgi:microcystin-dependent protein
MSSPFLAEIRPFGFNFAPVGWAFCNGQLLSISQNTALFSLLGTNFGGNGTSTFGLPNLQGSVPIHQGQGVALTPRSVGEPGGVTTVVLTSNQLPQHTHAFQTAEDTTLHTAAPSNTAWLALATSATFYRNFTNNPGNLDTPMYAQAIGLQGNGLPHNNVQPYLAINFCIAMQGIFPARN